MHGNIKYGKRFSSGLMIFKHFFYFASTKKIMVAEDLGALFSFFVLQSQKNHLWFSSEKKLNIKGFFIKYFTVLLMTFLVSTNIMSWIKVWISNLKTQNASNWQLLFVKFSGKFFFEFLRSELFILLSNQSFQSWFASTQVSIYLHISASLLLCWFIHCLVNNIPRTHFHNPQQLCYFQFVFKHSTLIIFFNIRDPKKLGRSWTFSSN